MKTEHIAAMVGVVALAAGVYWVFRGGEEAFQAAETRSDTTGEEADEGGLTPADPQAGTGITRTTEVPEAFLRRLDELGLQAKNVPNDHAMVIGLVLRQPPSGGSSETPPDPLPAAGATVAFHRVGEDGVADSRSESTASTRDDGWFLTILPKSWGFDVRASTDGHAEARGAVARTDLEDGAATVATLLLRPLVQVTVAVSTGDPEIGETPIPVEGMTIRARTGEDAEPLFTGTTDAKGEVVLPPLPTGKLRFEGELAPFASFAADHGIETEGQVVRINVDVVGRVRLRVRTPGGAVVSLFSVALDFRHDTNGYRAPLFSDVTSEDPQGWHVIEGVKAGAHDLYATAPGFAMAHRAPVEVRPGETTEVTADLPLGYRVKGQVVAKGDRAPVAGAVVFSEENLIPSSIDMNGIEYRPMARAVKTDARGFFTLDDLTEGRHRLTAIHGDHAAHTSKELTVGPGDTQEVTIELPLGATISGHCYGADGAVETGCMVMVLPVMDRNVKKKGPLMTTADDRGYYRIPHVPAGFMGIIKFNESGGEKPYDMKMKPVKDGVDLVVDFGDPATGATVLGTVTGGGELPTGGLTVMLMSLEDLASGTIPDFHQGQVDAGRGYEIRGVKAGRYRIQIARANKGSDFAGMDEVDVPESGVVRADIVLDGGSVEGSVVSGATGAGVDEGEVVVLDGRGGFVGRLTLDPGGTFRFFYVPTGTYNLTATGIGHAPRTVGGVQVRNGEVTRIPPIELDAGSRLVGSVLDGGGGAVEGAEIILLDPTTQDPIPTWALASGSDGSFEAPYVAVGSYLVVARRGEDRSTPVPVTMAVGSTVTVTLRFP